MGQDHERPLRAGGQVKGPAKGVGKTKGPGEVVKCSAVRTEGRKNKKQTKKELRGGDLVVL